MCGVRAPASARTVSFFRVHEAGSPVAGGLRLRAECITARTRFAAGAWRSGAQNASHPS